MTRFAPTTVERLVTAGWFDGRVIDVREFVASLEADGWPLFESALKFFSEFGGLEVRSFDNANDSPTAFQKLLEFTGLHRPKGRCLFQCEPRQLLCSSDRDDALDFYEIAAGRTLCPIGHSPNRCEDIFISDDSLIFSAWTGEWLARLAPNVELAMDLIVGGVVSREFPPEAIAVRTSDGFLSPDSLFRRPDAGFQRPNQ